SHTTTETADSHSEGNSVTGDSSGNSTVATTGSGTLTHDNRDLHVSATITLTTSSATTQFTENSITGAFDRRTLGSSRDVRAEPVRNQTLRTDASKTVTSNSTSRRFGNSLTGDFTANDTSTTTTTVSGTDHNGILTVTYTDTTTDTGTTTRTGND